MKNHKFAKIALFQGGGQLSLESLTARLENARGCVSAGKRTARGVCLLRCLAIITTMACATAARGDVYKTGGATITGSHPMQTIKNYGSPCFLTNGVWDCTSSLDFTWVDYNRATYTLTVRDGGILRTAGQLYLTENGTDRSTRYYYLHISDGGRLEVNGTSGLSYVSRGYRGHDYLYVDGGVATFGSHLGIYMQNEHLNGDAPYGREGHIIVTDGGVLDVAENIGIGVDPSNVNASISKNGSSSAVEFTVNDGTVIAKKIYVNPKVAGHVIKPSVTFNNCRIATGQIYCYTWSQDGMATININDAEIGTHAALFEESIVHATSDSSSFPSKAIVNLNGNGVTFNVTNDYNNGAARLYNIKTAGTGAFTKKGAYPLTIRKIHADITYSGFTGPLVCEEGTLTVDSTVTDMAATGYKALGGTLTMNGTATAAAADTDIALSGTGGAITGLTLTGTTWKSLTLGEDAQLPVTLGANGAATTYDASIVTVNATVANPVSVNVTTDLAALESGRVYPVIASGITDADLEKFNLVLPQGCDGTGFGLHVADGMLVISEGSQREAGNLVWNDGTSGADWLASGKWLLDGAPAIFLPGDSATFGAEGGSVTVGSSVLAAGLTVNGDTTVAGSGTLTVPTVSVAEGKTATVSAPTAGELEKTGAGTLTLGESRTDQTTVTAGTLAMAEGATVDPAKLTLGVAAGAPVTFDYGAQTLNTATSGKYLPYLVPGSEVVLTNGVFRDSNDLVFTDSNSPSVLTIAKDAVLSTSSRYNFNNETEQTINVRGGRLEAVADNNTWIMQKAGNGKLDINATEGAELAFGGNVIMLPCRDNLPAGGVYDNPKLNFTLVDSTLRLASDKTLRLAGDDGTGDKKTEDAPRPQFFMGATNSVIDVGTGSVHLGRNAASPDDAGGFAIAELNNTIVTAKVFSVYCGRPLTRATLDDVTFVLTGDSTYWVEAKAYTGIEGAGVQAITVADGGVTLDSQNYTGELKADLVGPGAVTKVGTGTLKVSLSQTSTAPLLVREGAIEIPGGVAVARPITLTDGTTIRAGLANGAFSQGLSVALDPQTEGRVRLEITGTPVAGTKYPLFASGVTEETIGRIDVASNYSLTLEDGALMIQLNPVCHTWDAGAGDGDKTWSTVANWDSDAAMNLYDGVRFAALGDFTHDSTIYDLTSAVFTNIVVDSGAWTTDVSQAHFEGKPIQIGTDAEFALVGATGLNNPFSTANNANSIAGILDLGGATQTGANSFIDGDAGVFRNGAEIRNGAWNDTESFTIKNKTVTIGEGATVTLGSNARFFQRSPSHLIVKDGGKIVAQNASNGTFDALGAEGASDGVKSVLEVLNGGTFENLGTKPFSIGRGSGHQSDGIILADAGNVLMPDVSIRLGQGNSSESTISLANGSRLFCNWIDIGYNASASPGKQTIAVTNSTIELNGFAKYKVDRNSSITFDGATLVPRANGTTFFPDLGMPVTIEEGGLTVSNAYDITIGESFAGTGPLVKRGGKTLTLTDDQTFSGNLVVSNGTLNAVGKTFSGGLVAVPEAGKTVTLDIAGASFQSHIEIGSGVTFTAADLTEEQWAERPVKYVELLSTGVSANLIYPTGKNDSDRYYFVKTTNGRKKLCYGKSKGIILLIR